MLKNNVLILEQGINLDIFVVYEKILNGYTFNYWQGRLKTV